MSKKITSTDGRDFERERLLEESLSDSDEELVLRSDGADRVDGKLGEVRLQVEEVTSAMRENVQKLMDRGDTLEDLNERSENFRTASDSFHSTASRLRRTTWWNNMKVRLLLGGFILLIIIIIIWASLKN